MSGCEAQDCIRPMQDDSNSFNPVPAAHRRLTTSVPPTDLGCPRRSGYGGRHAKSMPYKRPGISRNRSGWHAPERARASEGRGEFCDAQAEEPFNEFPSLTLRATGVLDGPDIADVWVAKPQDLSSSIQASLTVSILCHLDDLDCPCRMGVQEGMPRACPTRDRAYQKLIWVARP